MEALLRGPESRRIWLASHGLRIRGIAACELLAAGESKRAGLLSQVFVIMKALEHFLPLQVYVYRKTSSLKGRENALFRRGLARSVGRLLASLHEKKIFHADLKASNIMVNERGPQDWEFVLIDLDRVRFDKDLDLNRRARNLRQLESDLWPFITTTDRLRCFRAYGEAARLGDWRRVWQIIQWPLKR
jgi:tRNA A-37 threonylcarbamoyl transferase component Bud32